mmetsp:Transcript_32247/g.81418  ORF Transcript_32247/g.81418 Transcript_32247/m.81418 type:complete len:134 (+) Transcript_32247:760-1161(+)
MPNGGLHSLASGFDEARPRPFGLGPAGRRTTGTWGTSIAPSSAGTDKPCIVGGVGPVRRGIIGTGAIIASSAAGAVKLTMSGIVMDITGTGMLTATSLVGAGKLVVLGMVIMAGDVYADVSSSSHEVSRTNAA